MVGIGGFARIHLCSMFAQQQNYFEVKMNTKSLSVLFFCIAPFMTNAATNKCTDSIDMQKLRSSIESLAGSYIDIPTRIDCTKSIGKQGIICKNPTLRFMEKLDHMATFYGYENGYREEMNHDKILGQEHLNQILKTCRTSECICIEYKKSTDDLLGGMSPYQN